MEYKTLMVHMDLDRSNEARLRVVGDLAERFDAFVIGVAACDPRPPVYADGLIPQKVLRADRAESRQAMTAVEEMLREALKHRANRVEWRGAFEPPADHVARQGRAADLIVVGSTSNADFADPRWLLDPSDLVMRAGRPVLVVPEDSTGLEARRIVVGWKDTREARRAALDALPLACRAEKVIVATVAEGAEPDLDRRRAEDVAAWFVRHGAAAEARTLPGAAEPSLQLDSLAWEEGADLLVAGAYGHSRLRELILGGVTRDLITRTPRCALLSH